MKSWRIGFFIDYYLNEKRRIGICSDMYLNEKLAYWIFQSEYKDGTLGPVGWWFDSRPSAVVHNIHNFFFFFYKITVYNRFLSQNSPFGVNRK
jgi:hypothetical protein